MRWALVLNAVLLLGVGNAVIWLPLWLHWRVAPADVAREVIEAHRSKPDDRVLDLVAETSMTTDHPLRGEAAVTAARRLLAGELALPHLPVVPIAPEFSRRDLSQGVPVQQVFTASLIVPDLLLRAHEHEPDPAFVAAALRYLRGFVDFEASVHFPQDFERNSHAVANRASVLVRLWRHVRRSGHGDAETGRLVHRHAQRLAALLAKPSTFIASTNHGVMQNIGLLQLAAAFPELPDARAHRQLALQRLALQLPGYIGPDGAVLEHSAGYHFHGVVLSGYVVRLLQAQGLPVPPEWTAAHQQALAFLAAMQRPDRSLPQYGNTFRYAWTLPAVLGVDPGAWERDLLKRDSFDAIYPVSGHAIGWQSHSAAGSATHTLVPWGHFAGHGHSRAQELSLLIWSAGTDWSTNTGNWPGNDPAGVELAHGWDGGNGPHVAGESALAPRRSTLRAQAQGPGLRFLDLERMVGPAVAGSLRVRRQILQWQGSTWIVLDTYSDAASRELRVIWTAAPETVQRPLAPRQFGFDRDGSLVALRLAVDGSPGVTASPLRGSRDPFGGWVAFDRKAAPAPAVDARLPSPEGWMLATLALRPATESERPQAPWQASMLRYVGPQEWSIRLGAEGAGVELSRQADSLLIRSSAPGGHESAGEIRRLALVAGEPVDVALAAIEKSRAELLAVYPRFRTLETVRWRYSVALAGLWFGLSVLIVVATYVCARGRVLKEFVGARSRLGRS